MTEMEMTGLSPLTCSTFLHSLYQSRLETSLLTVQICHVEAGHGLTWPIAITFKVQSLFFNPEYPIRPISSDLNVKSKAQVQSI